MAAKSGGENGKRRRVAGLPRHEGEAVVLLARPARSVTAHRYLYTLGLYGIWRKRNTFVLTDRRVLIGEGLFNRSERSIPLDRIDDAVYTRRGVAAYSEVIYIRRGDRQTARVGPLTPLAAKRFTDAILSRI